MLGGLGLKIRQVPDKEAIETIFASTRSPNSRRGNRVLEILTLKEIQHLEEADPNPRGAMEVRCSVQRRLVLSVAELTLENVDRALMPISVVERVDTWSETVPLNRGQAGVNAHPRPTPHSAAATEPPKRNRFYALKGREEQEKSADVVTGMLQVFSTSVYALLILGLSFPL